MSGPVNRRSCGGTPMLATAPTCSPRPLPTVSSQRFPSWVRFPLGDELTSPRQRGHKGSGSEAEPDEYHRVNADDQSDHDQHRADGAGEHRDAKRDWLFAPVHGCGSSSSMRLPNGSSTYTRSYPSNG